jgi:predicted nucleic acid-binding protein
MIYLPDTNAFSAYLAGKSATLTERMRTEFAAGSLRLSVMVMAELEFGAEKARLQFGTTRFTCRVELLRSQLEVEPLGPEFPDQRCNRRISGCMVSSGVCTINSDPVAGCQASFRQVPPPSRLLISLIPGRPTRSRKCGSASMCKLKTQSRSPPPSAGAITPCRA